METQTLKKDERIIWLSCGENCMPINVLRRHNKKAPSTPFSTGRGDVEQIQYHEQTDYKNFLNPDYLIKADSYTNQCYLNISKKSSGACKPGKYFFLELTHHDPNSKADREAIERRINRMRDLKKTNEKIVLFYHHRSNRGFEKNREHIKKHFIKILERYSQSATALCYSQNIISTKEKKGLSLISSHQGRITFCTLNTHNPWAGNNLDFFFGRVDDNLFRKMFEVHENIIQKRQP
tara:strand:- start:802 stop:1509 length:708 start_codon:yes stop_codon:yes gene_type:complete